MEAKFFYTNAAEMSVSAYDITIKFIRTEAELVEGAQREVRSTPRDAIAIAMSPSHAKAIIPGLLRLIKDYEKQFGPIPLADEGAVLWKTMVTDAKE